MYMETLSLQRGGNFSLREEEKGQSEKSLRGNKEPSEVSVSTTGYLRTWNTRPMTDGVN